VQRRARASLINDVPRQRTKKVVVVVGGSRWLGSEPLRFALSSSVACGTHWEVIDSASRLLSLRCSSFAVDHLSPSRGSLLM
jgi:hypothetical protein